MTDSLAQTQSGPRSPESVLVARGVRKQFGDFVAVNDLSFEVRRGEIFALLGPNGAGKTTLLRMALDILKPDAGTLLLFGRPPSTDLKRRIGYLPEDRGLYRKQKLRAVLEYLAQLKGLDRRASHARVSALLERVGLADRAEQKIGELSKGMQQKVQFCGALVGRPELLVLDEPFSGLDPVNTRLLEDVLDEERGRGATIVLCTHQMAKVEQICDRALLIHRGRAVLHGPVEELIRRHSPEAYLVRTRGVLDGLPGVDRVERETSPGAGDGAATPVQRVLLKRGASPRPFLNALVAIEEPVESFARERVPLEEIFVQVVESSGEDVRGLLAESRHADRMAEASSA